MLLAVTDRDVIIFGLLSLFAVIVLFILFLFGIWRRKRGNSVCPYTSCPLRPATDLAYMTMEKTLRFLYDLHDDDNPLIDFTKAVFSRQTGRIFPNAIDNFGTIRVDWSFINKRVRGKFVSWGSLTEEEQIAIRDCHETLEGFQTETSSKNPNPSMVTREYAFTVPGPLYVDRKNKVLVGWKEVPDTNVEVLVVQKPTRPGKYML